MEANGEEIMNSFGLGMENASGGVIATVESIMESIMAAYRIEAGLSVPTVAAPSTQQSTTAPEASSSGSATETATVPNVDVTINQNNYVNGNLNESEQEKSQQKTCSKAGAGRGGVVLMQKLVFIDENNNTMTIGYSRPYWLSNLVGMSDCDIDNLYDRGYHQNGQTTTGRYLQARTVMFTVTVLADTMLDSWQKKTQLNSVFSIPKKVYDVFIITIM